MDKPLDWILTEGPYSGRTIEEVLELDPLWLYQTGYNITDSRRALDEKKDWLDDEDYGE